MKVISYVPLSLQQQKMLIFMATYGKGLICMPMSEEISKKLYFHIW